MKYLFALVLAIMLPQQIAASSDKITKELIDSQGQTRAYYLFVPKGISAQKPAPLIVLLHGSGRNGLSLVEKWQSLAEKEGIVLAGPDSTNTRGWSAPKDGPAFLHDLVEALKSKYAINPRRVYLFGHSAGAIFALYMSLQESQYFAATAVHAGALPQDSNDVIVAAKRKIPMAIWVGTEDEAFPLESVRATRDVLKENGFAIQLTEIPKHNHWYYDLAPKINSEAWEFLKKYELTDAPQYIEYNYQ